VRVEAISWALNLAPVPADRGGQPSSACKFVLVGLANHVGPDGCAFPAARMPMRYTGLSERTVRACLGRLEAAGLIRPCDPAVVAVTSTGVHSPHPVRVVDNPAARVQPSHPNGTGTRPANPPPPRARRRARPMLPTAADRSVSSSPPWALPGG